LNFQHVNHFPASIGSIGLMIRGRPARLWKAVNAMNLPRIISRVSVRTRIILLAAIPVAGFILNGVAFTVGDREVSNAFGTVYRASSLADASREFRGALVQIRMHMRDFITTASPNVIHGFETSYDTAYRTLRFIDFAVDESMKRKIAPLKS